MNLKTEHWNNWDNTQSCEAAGVLQPTTVEEVCDLVDRARREKRAVRIVGAGHSWSPLVPTDGYIANLDALCNVSTDAATKTATLQAGIRLKNIGPQLWDKGLAMKNLGAITEQSLAGAMSTGTHGTGLAYGCLGTQAIGCSVVDGTGRLREFSIEKNPREMAALRLSLGCLGIIVSITLQCTDAHMVELTHYRLGFKDCLDQIEELYTKNERVRFYWFPGSDELFVNTMNRTDKPDDPGPVYSWTEAHIMRGELMGLMWAAGRTWPNFIHGLNAFQEKVGYSNGRVVGPSYEAITTPLPPKHQECEVAVPLHKAREALETFNKLVREERLLANVPSEIRFVKGDDILLSPCNGPDTIYIGAYTATPYDRDRLFSQFCEAMTPFGGRPHWGKFGFPNREQAMKMYPKFKDFAAIREEMDPAGVFANTYIREIFALKS